jgi:hypothetical protein
VKNVNYGALHYAVFFTLLSLHLPLSSYINCCFKKYKSENGINRGERNYYIYPYGAETYFQQIV